ncbi:hypothetical protein QBC46DRAFT_140011 [Diplogelasinospora grovesii]|uniref:Myb/SANT-like domain-containing protein n=1 Tax=Diplogelasinospora grovesii TaxID=303347 RepID=A0AAN6MU09_9PEZI|nr:hypothetical protein QBC46DRAFT_140011 [Diplogelasinospora grovesii]
MATQMATEMSAPADDCVVVDLSDTVTDVPPHDWQAVDPIPDVVDNGDPLEPPPDFPISTFQPASSQQPSQPSTQVRKRKRTSTARLLNPTTSRGAARTNIIWTDELNRDVMIIFQDCKIAGLFNSQKKKDYGPAWQTVLDRLLQAYPNLPCDANKIAIKYDTERRRFQAFRKLLSYSGVSYNWTTGLPEASEQVWEQFFAQNNTKTRKLDWLRSQPLGDKNVYETVFWRERATGLHIVEVGEERSRFESDEVVVLDGTDSGRDNTDLLDSDDDEGIEDSTGPSTPVPNIQLTAARQHRNVTDPDLTSTPSRPLVPISSTSSLSKKRRTAQAVNDDAFNGFLTQASAAFAAPMVPSSNDISLAIDDLLERYQGSINNVEMKHCLKALRLHTNALMWNKLNSEMKDTFVEDWKEGTVD